MLCSNICESACVLLGPVRIYPPRGDVSPLQVDLLTYPVAPVTATQDRSWLCSFVLLSFPAPGRYVEPAGAGRLGSPPQDETVSD
jgi:hypothetical protein